MITLTFNTTTKEVKATNQSNTIIASFSGVPTVKPMEGYYEVIQEVPDPVIGSKRYPVARFPLANTIMFIEK